MGKITGFLEIDRHDRKYAPVAERVKHYREFVIPLSEKDTRDQAARCMNCGIPYCHGTGSVAPGTPGCPVNNQIPDFNDLVYQGNWEEASRNLHSTNNFPEFTGRICPAPCEASCTLNIDDNPVTIKTIECAIVDRAWDNGWLKPEIAPAKTGKKVERRVAADHLAPPGSCRPRRSGRCASASRTFASTSSGRPGTTRWRWSWTGGSTQLRAFPHQPPRAHRDPALHRAARCRPARNASARRPGNREHRRSRAARPPPEPRGGTRVARRVGRAAGQPAPGRAPAFPGTHHRGEAGDGRR